MTLFSAQHSKFRSLSLVRLQSRYSLQITLRDTARSPGLLLYKKKLRLKQLSKNNQLNPLQIKGHFQQKKPREVLLTTKIRKDKLNSNLHSSL